MTATVTPSTATGVVTFSDGGSTLGTGTLSGGVASFSTSTLSAGYHSLTASYGGNADHLASTSPTVTQTVFIFTLTLTPQIPSVYADPVTLTATIISAVSGTVTFADGAVTLGSVALSAEVA